MKINNKGTVSIEAAISLVVMISAVLTISLFARVAYVQGIVQHALVQTANEMATYSYIYSLTGLQTVNNAIAQTGNSGEAAVEGFVNNVSSVYENLTGGNYFAAVDNANALRGQSIMSLLKGGIAAIVNQAYGDAKTAAINAALTKPLMKTYLPDMEKFKKIGMFSKTQGGSDDFPIDLSYSSYFNNSAGDEINIVAAYNIDLVTPIPIIGRDITIVQQAKARAWMGAWEAPEVAETESIWDKPSVQRGNAIAAKNKNLNLPSNFSGIRGYKNGTAYQFNSINLNDSSYSNAGSAKSAIENAIKTKIRDVESFTNNKNGSTTISLSDINEVVYYIYIPKSDTPDNSKKVVRDFANNNKTIELFDDRKVPLKINVVEIDTLEDI